MTTLPAKAGRFWLVPEASALTGASRTTLTATRYVNVRRPDPGLLLRALMSRRTSPELVFLPSRGEVLNAISTAEHPKEPKLPRTRDMSYPRAYLVEPPNTSFVVRCYIQGTTGHLLGSSRRLPWMRGHPLRPQPHPLKRVPGRASAFPSGVKAGVPCGGFLWRTTRHRRMRRPALTSTPC